MTAAADEEIGSMGGIIMIAFFNSLIVTNDSAEGRFYSTADLSNKWPNPKKAKHVQDKSTVLLKLSSTDMQK